MIERSVVGGGGRGEGRGRGGNLTLDCDGFNVR